MSNLNSSLIYIFKKQIKTLLNASSLMLKVEKISSGETQSSTFFKDYTTTNDVNYNLTT